MYLLIGIGKTMTKAFIDSQIGRTRPVLFEAEPFGKDMCGFTDNYIKVKVDADKSLVNQIRNVELQQPLGGDEIRGLLIR